MATKKAGSLSRTPEESAPETPPAAEAKTTKRGQHLISGLFDVPVFRQFGVMAAERGIDKRELLREALNDLFIKHGKPPIA
jgi:hypothetical protein